MALTSKVWPQFLHINWNCGGVDAPPGYRFTAISTEAFSHHTIALIAPVPEPSGCLLAALGSSLVDIVRWKAASRM